MIIMMRKGYHKKKIDNIILIVLKEFFLPRTFARIEKQKYLA